MTERSVFTWLKAVLVLGMLVAVVILWWQPHSFKATFSKMSDLNVSDSNVSRQFSPVLRFNRSHAARKIDHVDYLDPRSNDAVWALLLSVKFRTLPQADTREVLAIKYNKSESPYPGWAVALANRAGQCCFPEVYWGSPEHAGAWYRYPRIPVTADRWWLVGVSFESQKYLVGWAGALDGAEPSVEVLGGHKVTGVARSTGTMYLGSPGGAVLNGGLGFAGIFRRSEDLAGSNTIKVGGWMSEVLAALLAGTAAEQAGPLETVFLAEPTQQKLESRKARRRELKPE